MKNTFVFDDLTKQDSVSQSYKNNYLRLAFEFLDQVYGDKNIYSTPRDLLKFDLALYSEDFLSKKMKSEMSISNELQHELKISSMSGNTN
mgnify:CR=1 FL=1